MVFFTTLRLPSLILTGTLAAMVSLSLAPAASAQTGPTRLDKIKTSKELRVCIWPEYYSITYRNPKTRQLSGIDIGISKDLGREMGVSIRYIESNFAQLIDALVQDRCDIAMHAVGITAARKEKLQFTQPYLRSDIYAVTTRSNTAIKTWADLDQDGKILAVAAGTVMEPVMQQRLKKAKVLSVKAPATREQEVEAGRADAFMTDFPYSRRMVDLTDWARVIAPPAVFFETDYAYALAPGEPSLLNYVNHYISLIKKDGRLKRFAEQNGLQSIAVLK